uniref:Putative secreted protein n=1 Tax=Amblyomma triste TaxID=251400 RepID=A0A023G1B8_AMBTT
MEKMIFCILALTLIAVALGADQRCSNKYYVDDECGADESPIDQIFHFNSDSHKCYEADICDVNSKSKYFSSREDCQRECDAREDSEEGGVGLED